MNTPVSFLNLRHRLELGCWLRIILMVMQRLCFCLTIKLCLLTILLVSLKKERTKFLIFKLLFSLSSLLGLLSLRRFLSEVMLNLASLRVLLLSIAWKKTQEFLVLGSLVNFLFRGTLKLIGMKLSLMLFRVNLISLILKSRLDTTLTWNSFRRII